MLKKLTIAAVLAAAVLTSGIRPAEAKLVEVWASGLVGAAYGNGKTDRDFFNWAGGGAGGVEVGARILFFSAYIDYLRFFGGDAGANLASFNLGGDGDIGLTEHLKLVFRLAGTFYLGSLDGADPRNEVDVEKVQTRGVGFRGGVGLAYTFAKLFSIGITPQVGYHYFFGGAEDDITEVDQNSSGWDLQAMGYLRFTIGI
jgi:hypothetical protein